MSSINGFSHHAANYQAIQIEGFDSDKPKHNPLDKTAGHDAEVINKPMRNLLDKTAGDDAEVFDHMTQSWQPTRATPDGDSPYAKLGKPYSEAIDFEITPNMMKGLKYI